MLRIALLLFLAGAAHADDILTTGSFHGDEMPYRDRAEFLTFAEDVLVPVSIQVDTEEDPIVDHAGSRKTGKRVSVPGLEDAFLIRGKNLHPGKITFATPDSADLIPQAWKATLVLGSVEYKLSYRCGAKECTLVLTDGTISQDIITMPIQRDGREINTMDIEHFVNFAGDLDHDGRLDLIMNLSRHYNETRPTLWLSSAAKEGKLVRMTAELSMSGC